MARKLLVTGGAGFIGANYVHLVLEDPTTSVVVLDKLTYAGNLANLAPVEGRPGYEFVHGDICDEGVVAAVLDSRGLDTVVNFAAETHVDRSISASDAFIQTNVAGTRVLLEAAKVRGLRYHQVSTDEVYGEVAAGASKEADPLAPRSPYAASKAGADLLVQAYTVTHGLHTTITRGSNNVGPYQYPEKALSLFATNALDDLPLPIYGDGRQERDYQWVGDHCEAIDLVVRAGQPGGVFNVGTGRSITNLEMARIVLHTLDKPESLIQHVTDRPGHDRRYALDVERLVGLGWRSRHSPEEAIAKAALWYRDNEAWWRPIKSGEFRQYYEDNYGSRAVIEVG